MKIKKLLLGCLFPFLCNAQAHIGSTETEIRSIHPDNIFTKNWTKNGQKYIMTKMLYGTFIYYFDENNLTNFNIQIPTTIQDANTQVEIYNTKYVITSKTSWTAYLDGGGIMKIDMIFDDELNTYIFRYGY